MILCENLVKIYKTDEIEVLALQGLDLTVEDGEIMAIIGNSGSGKSTLLNMLGALDKPSAGRLEVDGKNLLKFNEKQTIEYKRDTVGFVWQNNGRNLVPYLTALENIEMPMILTKRADRRQRAMELLDMVGMTKRAHHHMAEMSGGEQQRIAIAIALANKPKLLLADEPTGSVDVRTGNHILETFRRVNREMGTTVVIVSHDPNLTRQVDRVVAIRDGRTSSEFVRRAYRAELNEINAEREEAEREENAQVELAVVDYAGRLQVPQEYWSRIGIKGKSRVKVEVEGNRIVIENPGELNGQKD